MTKSGAISINAVQKIYDPENAAVHALENCTCEIPAGRFIAMVGPSGCGKSTLLNMIAGFDTPSKGTIQLDGKLLADPSTHTRPDSDRVVVFQNGALFPWKTVLENIAYGPIVQKKLTRNTLRAKRFAFYAKQAISNVLQIRFQVRFHLACKDVLKSSER